MNVSTTFLVGDGTCTIATRIPNPTASSDDRSF